MSGLYYKFDNIVTPKVCKEIIDSAGDTFKSATVGADSKKEGERQDTKIRKANVHWSNDPKYFEIVQTLVGQSNNLPGQWNLEYSAFESLQIGQYPKGGHYNWHVDGLGLDDIQAPENEFLHGKTRKLSFVLWLNDDFEGGDFEFHSAHIKGGVIKPKQGTIVLFPSWVMHRVKPVKKGIRYSAVSWLVGKPVR